MDVNSNPTASQQNKENFLFQVFFSFIADVLTPVIKHYFQILYLREFLHKFKIAQMEYTKGSRAKLIHEKCLKSKISCQTPFKAIVCLCCEIYTVPLKPPLHSLGSTDKFWVIKKGNWRDLPFLFWPPPPPSPPPAVPSSGKISP
jgi:hypothetical protein